MRDAKVELFRFASARDIEGGTNVAAFIPAVFHQATPQHLERWYCTATRDAVDFTQSGAARTRATHVFARAQFLVKGTLPAPSSG